MKIGICDDTFADRAHLKALLAEYPAAFTIVEYISGEELLAALQRGTRLDLLFLDIRMSGISGIDTAQEIRTHNADLPILFLTSTPEFAVDSYRVQAQDYLLKPVSTDLLAQSLTRQLGRIAQKETRIMFHTTQEIVQVPLSQIVYLEAVTRKVILVQLDGTTMESNAPIRNIEQELAPYPQFVRPHRSYLLNLHNVTRMTKDAFYTANGILVPIARTNMTEMKNEYMRQMLE